MRSMILENDLRGNLERSMDVLGDDVALRFGFMFAPVSILVLRRRTIVECNHEAETMFGFPRKELIGCSARMLFPNQVDFRRIGERVDQWLRLNSFYEDERFMQSKDGHIFWVRCAAVPFTQKDPFELMVCGFSTTAEGSNAREGVTDREKEIANYVVNGWTSRQIAGALAISPRTVETHRANLMKKFRARNVADLVSKTLALRQ
jgi:PAS domain S-box-containing protein